MSLACRELELDALLSEELSPAEAERVRAHVDGCAACQHALSWLKLERGWMTQRARRTPARPALDFSALQARLAAPSPTVPPAPIKESRVRRALARRGEWAHGGKMVMGAAAAVAFFVFGVTPMRPVPSVDEVWSSQEVVLASGPVLACVDPSGEAVAALEDRFGACLIASPALPTY
ncbi:zf-HC2 domain-containing protein [Hyalangium rubrum]|uniref:Zf-HC2 domain-containing protein n=1 Tax=Hyalangium rubrum TaxID=3103134 RepID=A0ABU5HBQ2_9BACT|nr:zf-HC2 domain-containing protein [Hyalangium sp. s54d21]MDY7230309.1 zf-HC2 domain-containing protein [Hyalangium sp. s54d21]